MGTETNPAEEHSHPTGGAWHVTRWVVPGCPACNPAEPGGGDVEALAWAINDAEDGGKTTPTYTEMARHILASDWLTKVREKVWDEAVREVADADPRAIHNPYRSES